MKGILLVMSDATPGDDDAYNAWYDDVHLADVLNVPGFVAARRFAAVPSVHGELPAARYLAIYEIDADDLDAVQRAPERRGQGDGHLTGPRPVDDRARTPTASSPRRLPMRDVDVLVVGSGAAGLCAAISARQAGAARADRRVRG